MTEEKSILEQLESFRELSSFERAVLQALPANVYTGVRAWRVLPPRQGVGIGRVGELPRRWEPDQSGRGPLESTVLRRRARNRRARAQRRVNRR